MATVRARYGKAVLTPLEPLDLEEDKEVVVSVEGVTLRGGSNSVEDEATKEERFHKSRGSCKGLIDGDAFIKMIYESHIAGSRDYPREQC